MSLGSLVVSLAANTAEFSKDLGKAAHIAEKEMERIKRSAAETAVALSRMFAVGLGSAALFTKQSIDAADAMFKMSQSAGVSTESFSALAYAARLSDVNMEQLGTSLSKLNRSIYDAAAGTGEARMAFDALGIKVKDSAGNLKTAEDVLREVAIKFSQMQDGAGKSALAIELFGRSGAQMIPMLNQGAAGLAAMRLEAEQLGQVISTEAGKAAEDFNDNLQRLISTKTTLGNIIMRELLPPLNALTNAMVEASKETSTFSGVAQVVKIAFQAITVLLSETAFAFTMIGGEIGAIGMQLAALARFDFKSVKIIGDTWTEEAKKAREEHDKFIQSILEGVPIIREYKDNWELLGNLWKAQAPPPVNKKMFDEQIEVIRGFVAQYEAALKTQEALVKEAAARGELKQREVIEFTAASEIARLQVLARALMQEAEIYKKQGELGKERAAQIKAQAAMAQETSTSIIAQAQLSSLEELEKQKAAKRAEAFNQQLAQSIANIQLESMTELELLTVHFEQKQEMLNAALENKMISEEEHRRLTEELELRHQAAMGNISAQGVLQRRKFEEMNLRQQTATIFGELASITAGVAQHNRVLFNINKAAGIANAIMNAYIGISKTLATYPWPWNIAMAAAHAAVAFAQVSAIRAQSFGAGGGAPSLAGSTAAPPVSVVSTPETSAVLPQPQPVAREVNIYVQGRTITREQLEEIADGLNELQSDGFPARFTVTAVS